MATAKKSASKKSSAKKSGSKKSSAKKSAAKQTSQCWPGFKPVAGKAPGTKGSCEPKEHQTSAQKKGDSKAAAASKLQKAGGSKTRANYSS